MKLLRPLRRVCGVPNQGTLYFGKEERPVTKLEGFEIAKLSSEQVQRIESLEKELKFQNQYLIALEKQLS